MFKTYPPFGKLWRACIAATLLLPNVIIHAQNSFTNGLVAYWNFDKKDFTDSWGTFDGTGEGSNPITFVDGKTGFGQGIQLDGVDQVVEITGRDATYDPDQLAFAGGSVSIAGWFKVGTFDKAWQALVAKGEGSAWRVARDNTTSFMSYAGGLTDATGAKAVDDGNWHHFAAISDANGVNFGTALYIDGALDGKISGAAALAANGANVKIGDNPGANGRYWTGAIDDVAIWSRVLTEEEIAALYNKGTGAPLSSLLNAATETVSITKQPANVTVLEGQPAVFSVQTTNTGNIPAGYQWQRNGTNIPAATLATYSLPVTVRTDSGGTFNVIVTVPGQSLTSSNAVLTVTPDMTPPTLVSATGAGSLTGVTVHYNKPLDPTTATNTANYAIDGGVTVSGAILLANSRDVFLSTSKQTAGKTNTITVNNVNDYHANTIAANSKITFSPPTLDAGLVAYWNFETNLNDYIASFNGTARGTNPVAFVDGKAGFGKAVQLDGTDQYIEITGGDSVDNLSFDGGSMSVSAWFKVDAFDKSWQALVAKGEGNNWRVARNNADVTLSYAGGLPDATGATDVSDGNWHHVVAISDATGTATDTASGVTFGTALYIDGVLDGSQVGQAVLAKNIKNVDIGENPDANGRSWHGAIDDVAIWNRVLADTEIASIYAGGTGKPISSFVSKPTNPTVAVTHSGNNLTIQWSPTGGTLESTPALGPTAVWTAVGTSNPATITIGTTNTFYRIRQ